MRSKAIRLTQNKVAIVDSEDYDRVVAAGSWYYYAANGWATRKAIVGGERRTRTALHGFVMDAPKGLHVAPLDGDYLNCQKSNLTAPGTSRQTKEFGPILRAARRRLGLSLSDVACRVGVSRQAVWFAETRPIMARTAKQYADALGLRIGKEPPNAPLTPPDAGTG